jgi:tRNA modification GTPase
MARTTASGDVIAAIATAPGRAGIGVVRVSGPAGPVAAVAEGIIGHGVRPRAATVVSFLDARGQPIDRGLALLFAEPASYTGETVLELQGHGGPVVLTMLLDRCVELGARIAEPGEFSKRAFLNGKIDLAQAESIADLIDAATTTAARAAARSLTGAFSAEIHALVNELIELRSLTEAALDFPEEDLDFIRAADAEGRVQALRVRIDVILARARHGSLLREGLHVVLIGRPNVGKSSLMNRLVGEEVAIVTAIPGTTRDAIQRSVEVHGIPLHVIDTAGLRDSGDAVERIGIERTWAAIASADVALIVTDPDDAEAHADAALIARLPHALRTIVVHNKIDTTGEASRSEDGAVWLSALTGAGVELLRDAVAAIADVHEDMEGAFIARQRHLRALTAASTHVVAASSHLSTSVPAIELFAEELRLAQEALTAITGEFGADDLLGAIFGRFCIGK